MGSWYGLDVDLEDDHRGRPLSVRLTGVVGWILLACGAGVLLYEAIVVVNGVSVDDLQRGPGHDPGTASPGRDGDFAVAGHRTTYGAPFLHLDSLRCRDRVLLADRRGRLFTDEVARQRVVAPTDVWVIGEHPLGTGRPALTLTTCDPRFSAEQRLIVHAELVS